MNTFQYGSIACTVLGLLSITSSFLVIVQARTNPVNSVLWLIVAFVSVACYLVVAGMTFIGLSYVTVYVGAIAVLFLFVVIILNLANPSDKPSEFVSNQITPVAVIIVLAGSLSILPLSSFISLEAEAPIAMLEWINHELYGSSVIDNSNSINGISSDTNINWKAGWYSAPISSYVDYPVTPITQIQVLGLTLYTSGALWLLLLSVLLMLAMIVPLALAFTS